MKHDLPCKKCGKFHGLGIHDRITDEFTPMDICRDCMVYGKLLQPTEKIILDETNEMFNRLKDLK